MAYPYKRRKYGKRRRYIGRRRRYGRRYRRVKKFRRAIRKAGKGTAVVYRRFSDFGFVDLSSQPANQVIQLVYTLNGFTNIGAYTSTYQQYKIMKIKRTIIKPAPVRHYAIYDQVLNNIVDDYTDAHLYIYSKDMEGSNAIAPANEEEMMNQAGSKVFTPFTRKITVSWKPYIEMRGYETVTTDAFVNKFNTWIDTTDTQVPHYGMWEGRFTNGSPAHQQDIYARTDIYVMFKGIKY